MKRMSTAALILLVGLGSLSCACSGYNTQRGTVIGGILGAVAGQAIGGNTASTIMGTAGGALVGAVIGNAADQESYNRSAQNRCAPRSYQRSGYERPPGEWVTVPGGWARGKWVPAHRVWVPVNPQ